MALTNNEKQIRYKKLEALKKIGQDVLVNLIFMKDSFSGHFEKTNEEIKAEIDSIVNLPSGWTDEDYDWAMQKIKNMNISALCNPHLMNNDINKAHELSIPGVDEIRSSLAKAPEVVRNIKSTLILSELNKSDQIAVVAEVMRRLAVELLNEKNIPITFANAIALSLIDPNYEKPEWVYEIIAQNLFVQNGKEKAREIAKLLTSPDIEKRGSFV